MKRENLRELGLDDEQIAEVMKAYNKSITSLNEKISDKDEELKTAKAEKSGLEKKVADMEEQAKKEPEEEKLDGLTAQEWKEKFESAEKEKSDLVNANKLDKELSGINAHDLNTVKKLLDMEKIKFAEDGVEGLKEQIEGLKESSPFLFKQKDDKKTDGFKSFEPAKSDGDGPSEVDAMMDKIFND